VASPVINDDIAAPAGSAIYRYDLAAALPVEALKLELGSDNSIATVQIASRDAEGAIWSQHANFTAFRLHQGERVIDNDAIQLDASTPSRRWFVRATPPLDRAPDLRVAWRPQRFVFLAQGHGPYRLIAGSATARRADYPIDIALAELRSRLGNDWQPPLAQLGARATLAGATALAAPPPQTERDWKTGLLWAVLVAAAGLIGALALSLLRQPKT
jgi:hypothetical protein